jgi:hypothetical protein
MLTHVVRTREERGCRWLALLILRRVLFPFSAGRAGLTGIDGAGGLPGFGLPGLASDRSFVLAAKGPPS